MDVAGWRCTASCRPDLIRHTPSQQPSHFEVIDMRKLGALMRTLMTAFTVATVIYAFRTKQPSGRFLRVPYDFRFPTLQRFRERFWNPDDPRIFTPHFFGVGWSVNVYQVRKRLRSYSGRESEPEELQVPQE